MKPTVVIGCDHAGYAVKQRIIEHLAKKGYTIVDVGGFSAKTADDYPDYAEEVSKAVTSDKTKSTKGVLICGSGTGMVIAANKIDGIRASVVYDTYSAKMARHDNDANVIALRGRNFKTSIEPKLVDLFLSTPFSGLPRHKRRLRKVVQLETQ